MVSQPRDHAAGKIERRREVKKNRFNWFALIYIFIVIIGVVFCGVEIFLLVHFVNTPIEEIPAWLLWLLFWRR